MVIHIYLNLIVYDEDRQLSSLIDTKEMERYSEIGTSITNDLIKEGRALELGISTTSQQTVLNLKHHKKLGACTEMFGESLLDLFINLVYYRMYLKKSTAVEVQQVM